MSESTDTLSYEEAKQILDDLLARSARDREFRQLCLLDGVAALKVASGRELPEGMTVHFVEHPGQGAGIMLPPLDLDAAALSGSTRPPGSAVAPPAMATDSAAAATDSDTSMAEAQADTPAPAETPPASDPRPSAPRGLNIRPRQG